MDRNWLIRTTQFQILGPITKEKVLEFYKKGALGPDDEICSGNGYWFSIREKDLVEKYLTGDLPQSFNPISEAPTVVALKASIADHTASLNRAVTPSLSSSDQTLVLSTVDLSENSKMDSQSDATAVISLKDLNSSKNLAEKLPKKDDLEYPDLTLPKKEDLEYPDMNVSLKEENSSRLNFATKASDVDEHQPMKYPIPSASILQTENVEPVHLPNEDDLAYPDLGKSVEKKTAVNSTPSKGVDLDLDVDFDLVLEEKKPTTKDEATKTQFMATSPGSSKGVLVSPELPAKKVEEVVTKEPAKLAVKPQEERKLLSERKKNVGKENVSTKKAQPIRQNDEKPVAPALRKRNDTYFFFIILLLILIILGVLFYYQEILNKPLPV